MFLILGAIAGFLVGLVTTAMMLPPVEALRNNPNANLGEIYPGILLKGAAVWSVLGLIHGMLLFFFSLGETPTIENMRRGTFASGHSTIAERFSFQHFGSKILPIAIVFGLVAAMLILPFISVSGVTEPRYWLVRIFACTMMVLIWTVSSMLIYTIVIAKIASR